MTTTAGWASIVVPGLFCFPWRKGLKDGRRNRYSFWFMVHGYGSRDMLDEEI